MLLISAQNSQQFFGTHFMHNITQLLQAVDFSSFVFTPKFTQVTKFSSEFTRISKINEI
jgi:hypothetical protein